MLSDQIVAWLKDVLKKSGCKGFVVGLSGGIDSAVTGALVQRAAGEKHLGLFLPCHSDPKDAEFVRETASILKLNLKELDLSPIYDVMETVLPEGSVLQMGNLKSRLRMIVLYHYAASHNYLVAGTSNKTEYLLGYFTKFGDGASDVVPLRDLLKREVVKLAQEIGLPQHIITRPPTAGLWPGQTDEAEIGLSYDTLDKAVVGLEEGSTILPFNAIQKVITMSQESRHKREGALYFKKSDADI